jgi:hypothetical protein
MYGDHMIATPLKRWCILATYWVFLLSFLVPRGNISAIINQEWMPLDMLHAVHLVVSTSVFLSMWTFSAYAFHRPFSLFAAIVYPIGQILDSLMWFLMFDIGRNWVVVGSSYYYSSPATSNHTSTGVAPYVGGLLLFTLYVLVHRKTLELSYLPEHHPPRSVRGNLFYVIAAVVSGSLAVAVYHWTGDLRWCILVKYTQDLYCCIRMRMPAPWMTYGDEHEAHKAWDWAGF